MRTDHFDFDLPHDSIASRPLTPRDAARLLHVTWAGWVDRAVRDLPSLIRPGDVMVFNDTRVLPARLFGKRGVVPVELLLHRSISADTWDVFAKPGKRLKVGQTVDLDGGLSAEVLAKSDEGLVRVRFSKDGADLLQAFHATGHMPLPPYIRRADDAQDRKDYQTVYAKADGSVAAPTAGLHFTPELLAAIDAAGATRAHVTLHVGAGTFLPVKVDDTDQHVMHAEWAEVSAATADQINAAKKNGGRIIAVGTTSLRTLESAANDDGQVQPFNAETSIFITPGYRFKAVDVLMTNFHLPKSTLFMLVSAFAGLERMKSAYAHAIQSGYRFYSYGDASWLEKVENQ
ncbi:MAG: tRNA preQ1(34) S-adenosylmethionine ribosyltransferase-isomerase QueA [Rhodospirillaceae bacterium]|nr:tRNA preQ1(34) S-adenosylmethionine ribosyltransferase-isomerase QueA [Rhodospirillaceae bacterium]